MVAAPLFLSRFTVGFAEMRLHNLGAQTATLGLVGISAAFHQSHEFLNHLLSPLSSGVVDLISGKISGF
jgi:hypothetical protein